MAVANVVEVKKKQKYKDLEDDILFEPASMQTLGGVSDSTMSFLRQLGERISSATGNSNASKFLRQRLAIAIQIDNSAFGNFAYR